MKRVRAATDRLGASLPLPNVSPNAVSGLSIITSILFMIFSRFSFGLAVLFLLSTLALDWFDGLIARKFNRSTEEGYLADIASDRFSEGIIFVMFFFPWFYLFILNCVLSMVSVARKSHFILPLRHVFLILYVISGFLAFPAL